MFGLPGGMEWVILAIIALLVFGGSRLASAGKNAGTPLLGLACSQRAVFGSELRSNKK